MSENVRTCYFGTPCTCECNDDTTISSDTIARHFSTFREILVEAIGRLNIHVNGWNMIGGPDRVVQVDEALIGRQKYHRRRAIEGTWVFGMVDDQGAVWVKVFEKHSQGSILRKVLPGSIIHYDSWRAYHGLDGLGYQLSTVNHSVKFAAQNGTHTQKVESQ